MSTWVIGDIHGCWRTLQKLLEKISWQPARDRLWLVGDLVNRGPDSLAVLRWARAHEGSVQAVLGNHDLHLLGRAAGLRRPRAGDTLDEVLGAPEGAELIRWLGRRPLMYREGCWAVVHAGLHPEWSLREATKLAAGIGDRLGEDGGLATLHARRKIVWEHGLSGEDLLSVALNIFVRVRAIGKDGRPLLGFVGPPGDLPDGATPWYEGSRVLTAGARVLFGHWAMAGLGQGTGWCCLDSGCVWGSELSALCLDDETLISVPCVPGDGIAERGSGIGEA